MRLIIHSLPSVTPKCNLTMLQSAVYRLSFGVSLLMPQTIISQQSLRKHVTLMGLHKTWQPKHHEVLVQWKSITHSILPHCRAGLFLPLLHVLKRHRWVGGKCIRNAMF